MCINVFVCTCFSCIISILNARFHLLSISAKFADVSMSKVQLYGIICVSFMSLVACADE